MTLVPRLWVGPTDEVLNCDEMDMSHALAVTTDAARFGLAELANELAGMPEDDDFDFDLAIALAERAGWTRISRDVSLNATVAISSASPRAAARALRILERSYGIVAVRVDVEISLVDNGRLAQSHHQVEAQDLRLFERHARLPSSSQSSLRPVPSWVVDTIVIREGKKRCGR